MYSTIKLVALNSIVTGECPILIDHANSVAFHVDDQDYSTRGHRLGEFNAHVGAAVFDQLKVLLIFHAVGQVERVDCV